MDGIAPLNGYHNDGLSPVGRSDALHAGVQNRAEDDAAAGVSEKKTQMTEECQTCSSRRYQDGSDDPGVSFKSPTKLSPAQAGAMVYSHEREHYSRENAKAEEEGREVLSNEIRVFTDVCPECGKTYVSGGETKTVTRKEIERAQSLKNFYDEKLGGYRGEAVDTRI